MTQTLQDPEQEGEFVKGKSSMPWPLMALGILLVIAVVALTILGPMNKTLVGPAALVAAGVAVMLGVAVVTNFLGSAHWLGQLAKDNASLFLKGAAPDSSVYRIIGVGFVVLGVAIGAVVLTHLPQ